MRALSTIEPVAKASERACGRANIQRPLRRERLVVDPPKFVPMSADQQRRAHQAFKALLIPYLRHRRTAQRSE